jgi:hypothetical protein
MESNSAIATGLNSGASVSAIQLWVEISQTNHNYAPNNIHKKIEMIFINNFD